MNKFFKNFFIVSGILILLMIIILILNNYLGECNEGHSYNKEINKCFYLSESCKENEKLTTIDDKSVCTYNKKGFLNTVFISYFLWILGISWLLIGLIFIITRMKGKEKLRDISEFKKEDHIEPKDARDLWAKRICERNNILIIDGKYNKSSFNFYNKTEPYFKGKEQRYRFQAEVKGGDNPGIYTVDVSLSRGSKWILGDNYREQHCSYDDFKVKRDMPISVTEDPRERMIEALYERHPERAVAIQEQMLEKGITQPPPPPPQETPEQPRIPRAMPYRMPYSRYRQPWRRY